MWKLIDKLIKGMNLCIIRVMTLHYEGSDNMIFNLQKRYLTQMVRLSYVQS